MRHSKDSTSPLKRPKKRRTAKASKKTGVRLRSVRVGFSAESIPVRVVLFDPVTSESPEAGGYAVFSGIEVEIGRIEPDDPETVLDAKKLLPDAEAGLFFLDTSAYYPGKNHHFRVHFLKRNFSKVMGTLLAPEEITPSVAPVFLPARLPCWDSGWDDNYETNEFFDDSGPKEKWDKERPIVLMVPIRRIFNIGHRGAPYHFPENTIPSFQKALDLGANGLEFDLCLTKDREIVVFHDAIPGSGRALFESLPYELVSPIFFTDEALMKEYRDGEYEVVSGIPLKSGHELDIINLTLDEIRRYFRYHHVKGVEYPIPTLEEFLDFASQESHRLRFLFFDVKNPVWNEDDDRRKIISYGRILGRTLLKYPDLPEVLVIANASEKVLKHLKAAILETGERRCQFAYDAAGSLKASVGIKKDPLRIARRMGNTVVSIGNIFRSGNLEEIAGTIRDRDYNQKSELNMVIHWTLNDTAQMYYSLITGVNGILTDRPDRLKALLDRLEIRIG